MVRSFSRDDPLGCVNLTIVTLSTTVVRPYHTDIFASLNVINTTTQRCVAKKYFHHFAHKDILDSRLAVMLALAERPIDVFHPEDFDPDHVRDESGSRNLAKIFEDIVCREDIFEKIQHLQEVVWVYRQNAIDPADQIPTNFVFSGPPGKLII